MLPEHRCTGAGVGLIRWSSDAAANDGAGPGVEDVMPPTSLAASERAATQGAAAIDGRRFMGNDRHPAGEIPRRVPEVQSNLLRIGILCPLGVHRLKTGPLAISGVVVRFGFSD
jgi:hypothetical protein